MMDIEEMNIEEIKGLDEDGGEIQVVNLVSTDGVVFQIPVDRLEKTFIRRTKTMVPVDDKSAVVVTPVNDDQKIGEQSPPKKMVEKEIVSDEPFCGYLFEAEAGMTFKLNMVVDRDYKELRKGNDVVIDGTASVLKHVVNFLCNHPFGSNVDREEIRLLSDHPDKKKFDDFVCEWDANFMKLGYENTEIPQLDSGDEMAVEEMAVADVHHILRNMQELITMMSKVMMLADYMCIPTLVDLCVIRVAYWLDHTNTSSGDMAIKVLMDSKRYREDNRPDEEYYENLRKDYGFLINRKIGCDMDQIFWDEYHKHMVNENKRKRE